MVEMILSSLVVSITHVPRAQILVSLILAILGDAVRQLEKTENSLVGLLQSLGEEKEFYEPRRWSSFFLHH